MVNYTYFQRVLVDKADYGAANWTAVVAAFNSSARVTELWGSLPKATYRLWAIHREYGFGRAELPDGESVHSDGLDESAFADALVAKLESDSGLGVADHRLAVDITGFMRPELVCLVQKLRLEGARLVDFLYAEPTRYKQKGWTQFSKGNVRDVRQVITCEGIHDLDTDGDMLLIGTGYDNNLMSAVAEHKPHSSKLLLLGFPSLAADMYQENVWRVSRASESIGASGVEARQEHLFAPANDPFVTAAVVSSAVSRCVEQDGVRNVYLAPLGTKVQALGFALFYAIECLKRNRSVSIILPFADGYERATSEGLSRTWRYTVDLQVNPS